MRITEFENDELFRVLNAILPFTDEEIQKPLYIMLKIIELNENYVPDRTAKTMSEEERTEAVLKAVRAELSEENGRMLDRIISIMETKKIISEMT